MNARKEVAIVGRAKEMIICGGENIYPVEIGQLLHRHPNIVDVHVVGVENNRLGEEICAWVRLHSDALDEINADAIRQWCKGKASERTRSIAAILFVSDHSF